MTLVSTFAVNRRSLKGALSRQIALTLGKDVPRELSQCYRARRDEVNRERAELLCLLTIRRP